MTTAVAYVQERKKKARPQESERGSQQEQGVSKDVQGALQLNI